MANRETFDQHFTVGLFISAMLFLVAMYVTATKIYDPTAIYPPAEIFNRGLVPNPSANSSVKLDIPTANVMVRFDTAFVHSLGQNATDIVRLHEQTQLNLTSGFFDALQKAAESVQFKINHGWQEREIVMHAFKEGLTIRPDGFSNSDGTPRPYIYPFTPPLKIEVSANVKLPEPTPYSEGRLDIYHTHDFMTLPPLDIRIEDKNSPNDQFNKSFETNQTLRQIEWSSLLDDLQPLFLPSIDGICNRNVDKVRQMLYLDTVLERHFKVQKTLKDSSVVSRPLFKRPSNNYLDSLAKGTKRVVIPFFPGFD